ncbi:MAG: hypothetical protein V3T33_00680, partial [Myxococcota bacterium]
PERQLIRWLNAQEEPPVVVSTACRELAVWTQATSHWIHCDHDPLQVRQLFQHLDVDYLILYPGQRGCRVVEGLENDFEPVESFGAAEEAIDVLRWRG